MNLPSDERHGSTWELIEDCVFAFEQDCHDGSRKPLDQYLPGASQAVRQAVLIELVKVDLELQWNDGRAVSLEEYCRQYGDLGQSQDLPPDLVYEAYRVACQHGKVGSAEQFCQSYPKQREAVLALAQRTQTHSTAVARQRPRRTVRVGDTFGDFELLALLGEGAFGQVFLARQISLARQVALKISANHGSEARTMASLDHDNIVKVFSEVVDEQQNLRLLCMQYVPGTDLGSVIRQLMKLDQARVDGQSIVDSIDQLSTAPAIFKAGALKERELLSRMDQTESVCWIGAKLAEALAYAHQQGVLHRDVKPDNVLISQFGRPLLADFNLSLDPHELGGTSAGMFGGSLAYMSPEHLEAFNPLDATPHTAVDERSDVFSLGIVLFELATLRPPFGDPPPTTDHIEMLRALAEQRRAGEVSPKSVQPDIHDGLDRVIIRCLDPDPNRRFQSGSDLADALDAARELQSITNAMPKSRLLPQWARRRVLAALLVAALIPNLVGSAVNISYNLLRIVPQLTTEQQRLFQMVLLGYNAIVYPLCVLWLCKIAMPIVRFTVASRPQTDDLKSTRQRVVAFPIWLVTISCLGWLPGGILFPLLLDLWTGPLPKNIFGHFLIDFLVSGLIALTYSYYGVETILLNIVYPKMLVAQPQPRLTAARELAQVGWRIRIAQVCSGAIPLTGAVLLVVLGPDEVTSGMFRLLVTLLIGFGMIGFCLSLSLTAFLQRVLAALR